MASSKTKAPEQTLAEPKYLRLLVDGRRRIGLKLSDNSVLEGSLEFFDESFLRITRKDQPNLFVYKHDIKYLWELD
jgi:hypothetical protein